LGQNLHVFQEFCEHFSGMQLALSCLRNLWLYIACLKQAVVGSKRLAVSCLQHVPLHAAAARLNQFAAGSSQGAKTANCGGMLDVSFFFLLYN